MLCGLEKGNIDAHFIFHQAHIGYYTATLVRQAKHSVL